MRPLFDNCARARCHIIPAKPFERELCKNAVKKGREVCGKHVEN